MSTEQIIVGFIVSTVGFSLCLFGRKQRRTPQLVAGVLMMGSPFVVYDAVWLGVANLVILVGMGIAVRFEV